MADDDLTGQIEELTNELSEQQREAERDETLQRFRKARDKAKKGAGELLDDIGDQFDSETK